MKYLYLGLYTHKYNSAMYLCDLKKDIWTGKLHMHTYTTHTHTAYMYDTYTYMYPIKKHTAWCACVYVYIHQGCVDVDECDPKEPQHMCGMNSICKNTVRHLVRLLRTLMPCCCLLHLCCAIFHLKCIDELNNIYIYIYIYIHIYPNLRLRVWDVCDHIDIQRMCSKSFRSVWCNNGQTWPNSGPAFLLLRQNCDFEWITLNALVAWRGFLTFEGSELLEDKRHEIIDHVYARVYIHPLVMVTQTHGIHILIFCEIEPWGLPRNWTLPWRWPHENQTSHDPDVYLYECSIYVYSKILYVIV